MTMKKVTIIASAIGLMIIVALLPGRRQPQSIGAKAPAQQTHLLVKRVRDRRPAPPADDLVEYRGQRVPSSAVPKLQLAERCKEKADELAKRYKSPHIARTLLEQIGPKLSQEDTAYAVEDRQKILDYFDWLSTRPEYTNIASIVASYDQDPSSSGLFLDASMYVALSSQNRDWQRQARADAEERSALQEKVAEASKVEGATPGLARMAEGMKKTAPGYLALTAEKVKDLDEAQAAYRELFRFRLKERFGLPDALLNGLDRITLTNAGPELAVPK